MRQGTVGAGTGAHAAALKGGIGSASVVLESGITVAALVVLNSGGSPVDPATGELWGARYGIGGEFAGAAHARHATDLARVPGDALAAAPAEPTNTTLAVVATDAGLDQGRVHARRRRRPRRDGQGDQPDPHLHRRRRRVRAGDRRAPGAGGTDGRVHPPGRRPLHPAGPDHRRRRRRRHPGRSSTPRWRRRRPATMRSYADVFPSALRR